MLKILKITCKEANEICNKAQYDDASSFEKMKLNLHILKCKVCALYTKQNRLLTKAYEYKSNECSLHNRFELDADTKAKLKEELNKQLK